MLVAFIFQEKHTICANRPYSLLLFRCTPSWQVIIVRKISVHIIAKQLTFWFWNALRKSNARLCRETHHATDTILWVVYTFIYADTKLL